MSDKDLLELDGLDLYNRLQDDKTPVTGNKYFLVQIRLVARMIREKGPLPLPTLDTILKNIAADLTHPGGTIVKAEPETPLFTPLVAEAAHGN